MKLNHLIYSMCAFGLLLTSCSQEDELQNSNSAQTIQIKVSDNGMTAGNPASRATTTGLVTTFTGGDEIGLYAVKDGAVLSTCNNLKLTFDGSSWSGLDSNTKFDEGTTFYAYYPYFADTEFSATDGFKMLTAEWNPATAENYDKSDLMTAENVGMTVTDGGFTTTIDLKLNHAMSMVELTASSGTSVTYKFTNDGMADYTVSTGSGTPVITLGSTVLNNIDKVDGKYRVLVNPATTETLTVSLDGKTYAPMSEVTWAAGNYYTMSVGSSSGAETVENYTLQVGDYLCADGTLISKDDADLASKVQNAVGVVYYVGNAAPTVLYGASYSDYTDSDGLAKGGFTHGLVIALDGTVMAADSWGTPMSDGGFLSYYQQNQGVIAECSPTNIKKNRILGYDNTATIRLLNASEGCYQGLINAINAAPAAPSSTSGWFVPSNGDQNEMLTNTDALGTAFTAAGHNLWESGVVYLSSSPTTDSKKKFTGKFYGCDGSSISTSYTLAETAHTLRFALAF